MTALHYRLLVASTDPGYYGRHPGPRQRGEPRLWPIGLGAEVSFTPPSGADGDLGALLSRGGDILVAYARSPWAGTRGRDLLRVAAAAPVYPGHWVATALDAVRDIRALLPPTLVAGLCGEPRATAADLRVLVERAAAPLDKDAPSRREALRVCAAALDAVEASVGGGPVARHAARAWLYRDTALGLALGTQRAGAVRPHLLTGVDALAWRVLLQTPPPHLTLSGYGGAP